LERHQAEIRKAVADESLNEIANSITGEESRTEWLAEGRRLVPLIPRSIPQTRACQVATSAAAAFLKKQSEQFEKPEASSTQDETMENSHGAVREKRPNRDSNNENDSIKSDVDNSPTPASSNETSVKKMKLSNSSDMIISPDTTHPLNSESDSHSSSSLANSSPPANSSKGSAQPSVSTNKPGPSSTTSFSSHSLTTDTDCTPRPRPNPAVMVAAPIVTRSPELSNLLASNTIPLSDSKTNLIQLPSNTVKFTPAQIAVPCSSGSARILSTGKPGTIASQVVVISSNSQPKTITIPISQSVPIGTVASSGGPTIFYQTTSNSMAGQSPNVASSATVKTIPAGFTIKAFKPGQTPLSGNFIIMPKNATVVRPANIRTITLSKETTTVASSESRNIPEVHKNIPKSNS
jgi:hypothetical protein